MPAIQYWFSGPAVYLAASFIFATVVGLIGIRFMISTHWYYVFVGAAVVLSSLAWRTAAIQERDAVEMRNQLTGGDSYCYLLAMLNNPKDLLSPMQLSIVTSDKYPLYDVHIALRRNPNPSDTDEERLKKLFTVETHQLGTVLPWGTQLNLSLVAGDYTIEIAARNGSFTERLRLIPVEGEIKQIIEVYRFGTGERLFATPVSLPPDLTH